MHSIFWVEPEGMRKCAREHNIKTDLKHTGWEGMKRSMWPKRTTTYELS
jgi:hypothetical protein